MSNALGTIRCFTNEDKLALDNSALRFMERHGIQNALDWWDDHEPCAALDAFLSCDSHSNQSLRRNWQACRCRALGVPIAANVTVAYGYVGYYV